MITVLDKRGWVLANPEWFMNEIVFHRENYVFFRTEKIPVWKFDEERGEAKIK